MNIRKLMSLALITALLTGISIDVLAQAAGNRSMANVGYSHQRPQVPINPSPRTNLSVSDPSQTSIVLEADVMINVPASSYVAIFSATQKGESVAATDEKMNARINKLSAKLEEQGVPKEDIHVDFISLVPMYDVEMVNKTFSNAANEVASGFLMKKNIHVIFKNHRLLDAIITYAAESEIYDIVKVDYNVDNIKLAYDSLRQEASRIIDQKRQIYHDMGLTTKVVNLSEGYNCSYPVERYASYTVFHKGKSEEKAIAQNQNLKVNRLEKNNTIYYDRIPYNQFDMVLNADSVEPMVQFFYKLKVRYSVAPEKEDEPIASKQ